MAASNKSGKPLGVLEIEGELLNCVAYATYYNRIPLFTSLRLTNGGREDAENLTVRIEGTTKLVLTSEVEIAKVPAESGAEVTIPPLLNPKYLAELEGAEECLITVTVYGGGIKECSTQATVKAIPMDSWSGVYGNAEMLSAFVRPKLPDCINVLAEAGLQLRSWGYSKEWSGYSDNDKNAVLYAFASIFSAVRNLNIERLPGGDLTQIVSVGNVTDIVSLRQATPLALAVFTASCLEAAKLNPLILAGKDRLGVGVWLHESCFNSPLQDDMSVIERYVSSGVNRISVIDVNDLFAHKNASFTTSASHFLSALQSDKFICCIDVKRTRIGGVFPMPLKVGAGQSYELLGDNGYAYNEKPEMLLDTDALSLSKKPTKEMEWERRLLDLTLKNNLLNFRYRHDCVRLLIAGLDSFCEKLGGGACLTLMSNSGNAEEGKFFGLSGKVKTLTELISIELKSGIVRAYQGEAALQENVHTLIRKGRASREEVGANTLYLALGFLKWKPEEDAEFKYAPIMLQPVNLKATKTSGVTLEIGEDYSVNSTLLEFLKQNFGVDIRGVEDEKLSPAEVLAVFRAKTSHLKGWLVYEDAYLAQFTFAGYAIWKDIKDNISLYSQNPVVAGLLGNTCTLNGKKLCAAGEDEADPTDVLTPLSCDSSQYSAVAEASLGTSFVLHGPPGTGKSQTITNIIANALHGGKRVLFVAEKQAALQVVKKRLSDIGIGDFCLELHSGKNVDKADIVRSIENTLALKPTADVDEKFNADGQAVAELRKTVSEPLKALHKKRGLGISVYEGILYYLSNADAPELMNIESTFYDSLTAKKLARYENMLVTARAAAKECGGVYRSPFSNVNLTFCDEKVKRAVLCSAQAAVAELKHLKNYLTLFLETFNQKISVFTLKKLSCLVSVIKELESGELDVFFNCGEAELHEFYNANLKYDADTEMWLGRFKTAPDLSKYAEEAAKELADFKGDFRTSRYIGALLKRIGKLARTPLKKHEELQFIKLAVEIEGDRKRILATDLSENFLGIKGGINSKKRSEFLKPLYELRGLCLQLFMDYNADSFNSVCVKAADGHLKPLYSGICAAERAFREAIAHYERTIKSEQNAAADGDVFTFYSDKCNSLIDNIDMLPAWCMYKDTAKKLNDSGLTFITDALESGQIKSGKILSAFRKNVYGNFVRKNIPADPGLSCFSATVTDEAAANLSRKSEEFNKLARVKIRNDLISRLPGEVTGGALAQALTVFRRRTGGNLRGFNLRGLFSETDALLRVAAPCMLMSPFTVSQYLPAVTDLFDLVIFDEASQLPTCEAVPSLARGKSAVIVGDPKQMPPTSFFMSSGDDEDSVETVAESVLDDCLALGMPEKHLVWHYRSKHESLIAFSNVTYYSSKLCTFPSPDAPDSHVKFVFVENGVYERGGTKSNAEEAAALVAEVVRRLSDPVLKGSSIGIVTFSTPQQVYIERLLAKKLSESGLEEAAYGREEPLFVKNLENVQGDERDVILFSVCYGPDAEGKLSLNFGPLNRTGGWRRLNVAASRAREEMVVFSSMRYSLIDLSRTASRGVAGLKAFLEFAEKGKIGLAAPAASETGAEGMGAYIAAELKQYGYDCRCGVGVSGFKIDVGVLDPENKKNFILAVLCDGTEEFSIKDKFVMQVNTLKRNNWNVLRIYSVNFFNNPKREVKRIRDYLDRLTLKRDKLAGNFKKPYRRAKVSVQPADARSVLAGKVDGELIKALKAVVAAEEPISESFLIKRTLAQFGINRYGERLKDKIASLIPACSFKSSKFLSDTHYFKRDGACSFDKYRVEEGQAVRTSEADFSPYDIVTLVKAVLTENVSMYRDEIISSVAKKLRTARRGASFSAFINECIEGGVSEGVFIKSVTDRISLA